MAEPVYQGYTGSSKNYRSQLLKSAIANSKNYAKAYDEYQAKLQVEREKEKEKQQQQGGGFDPLGFIGNVGGAIAKGIAEPFKYTGEGIANVIAEANGTNEQLRQQNAQQNQLDLNLIKKYGEQIRTGTPDQKAKAKAALAALMKQSDSQDQAFQQEQQRLIDQNNPIKGAAAVGELGLNVLTAGSAAPLLQGSRAARAVGGVIAPIGFKQGLVSGAVQGGLYGALGTAEQNGEKATLPDYLTNTIIGSATGGVLGGTVPLLGAAFRQIRDQGNFATSYADRQIAKLEQTDLSPQAKRQIADAIQEKGRYKQPFVQRVSDSIRRNVSSSTNWFERNDIRYAKATGTSVDQLKGEGRLLGNLALQSRYYGTIAEQMIKAKQGTGKSVEDILKRYQEGTPKGQEFVNYLNNKRTLDFYAKTKKNLQPQYDLKQMRQDVKAYESKNQAALGDLKTLKDWGDTMVDYAKEHQLLSAEDAQRIKDSSDIYSPLVRATPEDVVRPEVRGGINTNVSNGPVQTLKGGSQPFDVSLSAIIDKNNEFVRKSLQNKFDNEILRRYQEGHLGGNLIIDPAIVEEGQQLREIQQSLITASKAVKQQKAALKSAGQKAKSGTRITEAEVKALNQKAVNAVRTMLRKVQRTPVKPGDTQAFGDVAKFADSMSDKQALKLFDVMTNYSNEKLDKVFNQLEQKNAKLADLRDTVAEIGTRNAELTAQSKGLKADRADIFNQLLDISPDPSTGLNVINGFKNGTKFKLEVAPDLAKAIQALSPKGKLDSLSRMAQLPANVQKFVFTGPGAPVFATLQLLKNTGVMFTNSRGLSPFGARAIASFFIPDEATAKLTGGLSNEALFKAGAVPETYTQTVNDSVKTAVQYAGKGLKNVSGKVNYAKNAPGLATKDFFKNLNRYGAFINNRQRKQIATGAYLNAKNRGFTDEEAVQIAADAYNEVLGNFNRASRLAQTIEPLVLYSGATQQGAKALFKAFRERPVETTAKLAAISAPMAAFAYNNMASQTGRDYMQDMYDNGKAYQIDNYLTFVAPGAHKDTNGRWVGIVRIPITPDFRPINKAINEQIYGVTSGEGVDGKGLALAGFNFVTGGILQNPGNKSNIDPGFLGTQIPAAQVAGALYGFDVEEGKMIDKQDNSFTSEGAKVLSSFLGGGISGNQIDTLLQSGGMVGRVAQGRDPVGESLVASLANNFQGPFSSTKAISKNIDELLAAQDQAKSELGKTDDPYQRELIKARFNQQIADFGDYISENSRIRSLSDKQKKLLEAIRLK